MNNIVTMSGFSLIKATSIAHLEDLVNQKLEQGGMISHPPQIAEEEGGLVYYQSIFTLTMDPYALLTPEMKREMLGEGVTMPNFSHLISMSNYIVLRATHICEFERLVNVMMSKGWISTFPPIIVNFEGTTYLHQPMVTMGCDPEKFLDEDTRRELGFEFE